jgi:hypothetical protein
MLVPACEWLRTKTDEGWPDLRRHYKNFQRYTSVLTPAALHSVVVLTCVCVTPAAYIVQFY